MTSVMNIPEWPRRSGGVSPGTSESAAGSTSSAAGDSAPLGTGVRYMGRFSVAI